MGGKGRERVLSVAQSMNYVLSVASSEREGNRAGRNAGSAADGDSSSMRVIRLFLTESDGKEVWLVTLGRRCCR